MVTDYESFPILVVDRIGSGGSFLYAIFSQSGVIIVVAATMMMTEV